MDRKLACRIVRPDPELLSRVARSRPITWKRPSLPLTPSHATRPRPTGRGSSTSTTTCWRSSPHPWSSSTAPSRSRWPTGPPPALPPSSASRQIPPSRATTVARGLGRPLAQARRPYPRHLPLPRSPHAILLRPRAPLPGETARQKLPGIKPLQLKSENIFPAASAIVVGAFDTCHLVASNRQDVTHLSLSAA
jgi:hypothetical protein